MPSFEPADVLLLCSCDRSVPIARSSTLMVGVGFGAVESGETVTAGISGCELDSDSLKPRRRNMASSLSRLCLSRLFISLGIDVVSLSGNTACRSDNASLDWLCGRVLSTAAADESVFSAASVLDPGAEAGTTSRTSLFALFEVELLGSRGGFGADRS